jgi:vacuolar-type H+-ATPase subunit I/STV1
MVQKMSLFDIVIKKNVGISLLMSLAEEGIVHIKPRDVVQIQEQLEYKKKHKKEIQELKTILDDLFKALEINQSTLENLEIPEKKEEFKIKDLYGLIHYIKEEINFYMNRINELERYITKANIELENINNIKSTYTFLDQLDLNRTALRYFNQLDLKAYITFSKNLSILEDLFEFSEFPNVYQYKNISNDMIAFYVIFPKINEEKLKERINLIHGEEIPILKKYLTYEGINFERINKEIDSINKTLEKYKKEQERLRNENLKKFAAIKEVIENLEEYNWAESQFIKVSSDKLALKFFVPFDSKEEIKHKLKDKYESNIRIKITNIERGKKVDEDIIKPEERIKKPLEGDVKKEQDQEEREGIEKRNKEKRVEEQTPTKFKHNRIIRPFELLTKMYGIPSYSEVDPTAFLFITFPLLFGIMFGDIGHGIVLIFSGIIGAIFFRNRNKKINKMSLIIFYCGWWAILFGFLYGEFFGGHQILEYTLEPVEIPIPFSGTVLLHKPLDNVMSLFWVTIFVGVIHINLGLILQFANYIINSKKYLAVTEALMKILFLDSIVFLVVMWGIDINAWISEPYPILLPLIPGILLILAKPLGKLLKISYMKKESYGQLLTEGSIETFETVLSIPSNILSYLRLLALALAHISLMVAITEIAKLFSGPQLLTQILVVIILIFGNAIVILLEGITVFINALRLNFYEFFFKFYEGQGAEFSPFILEEHFSKITFKPEVEKDVISEEIEKEIETKKAKEYIKSTEDYISEKYLK